MGTLPGWFFSGSVSHPVFLTMGQGMSHHLQSGGGLEQDRVGANEWYMKTVCK